MAKPKSLDTPTPMSNAIPASISNPKLKTVSPSFQPKQMTPDLGSGPKSKASMAGNKKLSMPGKSGRLKK